MTSCGPTSRPSAWRAQKILRTVVVYLILALLLPAGRQADLAQLTPSTSSVMLLLSNVVQNAVIGPDNSLAAGCRCRRLRRLQRGRRGRVDVLRRRARCSRHLDAAGPARSWDLGAAPGGSVDGGRGRHAAPQNANNVADTATVASSPAGLFATLCRTAIGHPRGCRASGGEARHPAGPGRLTAVAGRWSQTLGQRNITPLLFIGGLPS